MPIEVSAYLFQQLGFSEHPETVQTVAYVSGGEIRAAFAFHHASALSCACDLAVSGGFLPQRFFYMGLWYPFIQLGVRRLTLGVAASNLKSINLVERLGAYREATLQDGCSAGDVHIYCLRPEKSLFWRKLHGKFIR